MRNCFFKLAIQRLVIPIFLFPIFIFGQSEVLIFKTLEDYKVAKGVIADNVFIIKRKDKEVKKYGGNDFMISTSDKNLSYMIDKYYWSIFKNDSLFINGKPLGIGNGYAYAEQIGNSLFIITPATAKYNLPGEVGAMVMCLVPFGLVGATAAGVAAAASSTGTPKYIYYVMDMQKEKTKRLTKNRMNELLLFDEQLANQYLNEPYPKIANTQKKYLIEYKKNLYAE